jgi:hypothetical protein
MLQRVVLSLVVTVFTGIAAGAADLPAQSRLGALFAEPDEARPDPNRPSGSSAPITKYHLLALVGTGGYYYGSPHSYLYNGPYYGGPYDDDGIRLPYACGLYGYC